MKKDPTIYNLYNLFSGVYSIVLRKRTLKICSETDVNYGSRKKHGITFYIIFLENISRFLWYLVFNIRDNYPNVSIESLHVTSYSIATVTFVLSVTTLEIFRRNTRDLDLTFRMCQGQISICQSKGGYATSCVGNSNVCLVCHRLRDNQVQTSQCTRFNFLPWKCRSRTLTNCNRT